MPVRYPPSNSLPPGKVSREPRNKRLVAYTEPKQGFGRRLLRRLFSAAVIIPVVFVGAVVLGVLIYYWTVFSGRIDNLLKGEVFTRSAGIYAAPKQLRLNETITPDKLIEFLKHAGYVEKSQQADKARGRYSVGDGSVDVEPSENITVDGQRQ